MIDQYVRGELADPSAFEGRFLSSPSRREKVAFARALMHSPVRGAVAPESASSRSWAWQIAAAVVLLVAGGWWLVVNRQLDIREQPSDGQQVSDAVRPDSGATGTSAAPAQPTPGPSRPLPPPVATLLLTPALTRGAEEAPVLIIGDNVQVRLRLELEAGGYERYRATIRTANGEEIWTENALMPEPLNGIQHVTFTVPANRFVEEDYLVRLSGLTPSSDAEEVARYSIPADSCAPGLHRLERGARASPHHGERGIVARSSWGCAQLH